MNPLNRYHRKVTEWLTDHGISYMEEYPVGRWHLDLYLNEIKQGVEIDGPQHSFRRRKDIERDYEIYQTYGIPVIRIKVGTPKDEVMELLFGSYDS